MKPNQLSFTLLLAIFLFFCSSSLNAQVTVHQHCNFTGWTMQLDAGNFNSNDIRGAGGLPNDASSIKISPGYTVTLFSGDNFTGNSITYSSNDDCLVNESFNDVVSSIRVTSLNVLTLFQHCGYSGWDAQFGVGNFTSDAIRAAGGRPNDASSIKIAEGYQITVYRGDNFTGNSITYAGDDDCFVNEGYNDVISSFKVEKVEAQNVVSLFQHCNYGGWEAKFGIGNFTSGAIWATGGRPNDASSIKIAEGYQITVYRGDNFTGNSITYAGDDDCFVNEGYNDVISSFKIEKNNSDGDWDNFPYPVINLVDQASYHNGSKIFWDAFPNAEEIIKQLILEVCKKIYYNDNDNLLRFNKLNLYLRDEGGIAAKWGSPPEISIKISVRHIENIYNSRGGNLRAVKEDIEGILSHECTHAYQWGPRNAGSYQQGTEFYGYIEGLADYVRISLGRHPDRSPRRGGSWTSGYTTTGFFINWIVNNKDSEFAIKFNHSARTYRTWSWDTACRNIVGETVQSLWNQYQNSLQRSSSSKTINEITAKEAEYDQQLDCDMKINSVHNHITMDSKLYPNPVHSLLHFEVTGTLRSESNTIEIHNLSGMLVKNIVFDGSNQAIDMSDLPSGIYIVTIKNSEHITKKRIVKQ
ncbi:basic secretory protein-like protein [Aquimarina celericrescens]|uniref:Basic secretory protein-like protein n=1 Tax=Aquimarina celericrescens TaxID=1964542 RepID=A0ABW5AXG9_9FLAO|nr:T9SS type A sorting domain-containing protein [Aquimarina celericrescens]